MHAQKVQATALHLDSCGACSFVIVIPQNGKSILNIPVRSFPGLLVSAFTFMQGTTFTVSRQMVLLAEGQGSANEECARQEMPTTLF